MRRVFLALIMVGLLVVPSFAFDPDPHIEMSAVKTADGTVFSGSGFLYGIIVNTDGTNDVTLNGLYDNTAASGTRLLPTDLVVAGEVVTAAIDFNPPLVYNVGVTMDLTTAGTTNIMFYYRAK